MRFLWQALGSHRLAGWLIGILVVVLMLGGSLPQRPRLSPDELRGWQTEWGGITDFLDGLQLSHIFGAGWFDALCLLLIINLSIGILISLQQRRLHFQNSRTHASTKLAQVNTVLALSGVPLAHLGMLTIIVGAYISSFTAFGAHLELSEGEVFNGAPNKVKPDRGSYRQDSFAATLRLDRIHVALHEGRLLQELRLDLSHQEQGQPVRQNSLITNAPIQLSGYSFYPNNRFGYSALCERRLASGERRLLLVNFAIPRPQWNKDWRVENRQRLPSQSGPLYYRMSLQSGQPPVLDLDVSQGAKAVFQGQISPGDKARIGDELWHFIDIRPWAGLYMAADAGKGWVFLGMVLVLTGFLLHLLLPRPEQRHG